jgi:hypothetical protein
VRRDNDLPASPLAELAEEPGHSWQEAQDVFSQPVPPIASASRSRRASSSLGFPQETSRSSRRGSRSDAGNSSSQQQLHQGSDLPTSLQHNLHVLMEQYLNLVPKQPPASFEQPKGTLNKAFVKFACVTVPGLDPVAVGGTCVVGREWCLRSGTAR